MKIGDVRVFELVVDRVPKIGEKFKDTQGKTWRLIERVETGAHDKFKCKLMKY
jgi:hypothetical protein